MNDSDSKLPNQTGASLARYFSVSFQLNKGNLKKGSSWSIPFSRMKWRAGEVYRVNQNYPLPHPVIMDHNVGFSRNTADHRYESADKCIYCGKISYSKLRNRLGDEHVIAESLGSYMVLPRASCQCHERTTT